ncbi:MAG: polysaccharide deacetylase family protein [Euryarchaeota archaeon]|nr:polysaccharide deacetylase family protein [Euryarchaeota archaeon]
MQKRIALLRVVGLVLLLSISTSINNDMPLTYGEKRSVRMIVTIDWEKEKPNIGGKDQYETVEETTAIILDMFEEHDIHATFLVEYDSMANMFQFEKLIERMIRDGHEIGLHFHGTDWYNCKEMKEWIRKAREEARRYDQKLVSFRAGCFIMTKDLKEALRETGFLVDLSKAPGYPGWDANDTSYWDGEMLILPLTCSGRKYLNFYNKTMKRITVAEIESGTDTLVLYFHNWNIVNKDLTLNTKKIEYMYEYFTFLEKEYDVRYVTCGEYYDHLRS